MRFCKNLLRRVFPRVAEALEIGLVECKARLDLFCKNSATGLVALFDIVATFGLLDGEVFGVEPVYAIELGAVLNEELHAIEENRHVWHSVDRVAKQPTAYTKV